MRLYQMKAAATYKPLMWHVTQQGSCCICFGQDETISSSCCGWSKFSLLIAQRWQVHSLYSLYLSIFFRICTMWSVLGVVHAYPGTAWINYTVLIFITFIHLVDTFIHSVVQMKIGEGQASSCCHKSCSRAQRWYNYSVDLGIWTHNHGMGTNP